MKMAGLNLPFDIREVLFWFFLAHRKKCVFLFSHFMQDLVPVTLYNNLGVSPKPATLLLCTGYEELTYVIKNSTNSSLLSFPPTSCLMILLFLPQPMPVVHQNYAFLVMFVYFQKGKKIPQRALHVLLLHQQVLACFLWSLGKEQ